MDIHQSHIILSSVTCPALPYLTTSSHKSKDTRRNLLLNMKHVFDLLYKNFSEIFCILIRIQRDVITNVHGSSWKNARYYCQIFFEKKKLEFSQQFFEKKSRYQISLKSPASRSLVVPCGSTGQTWRSKRSPFSVSLSRLKRLICYDRDYVSNN